MATARFLADLAEEVGLDRSGYLASLDDGNYAARHTHALTEASEMGITVAPTIVIGSRRINGLATEGVILRALREMIA